MPSLTWTLTLLAPSSTCHRVSLVKSVKVLLSLFHSPLSFFFIKTSLVILLWMTPKSGTFSHLRGSSLHTLPVNDAMQALVVFLDALRSAPISPRVCSLGTDSSSFACLPLRLLSQKNKDETARVATPGHDTYSPTPWFPMAAAPLATHRCAPWRSCLSSPLLPISFPSSVPESFFRKVLNSNLKLDPPPAPSGELGRKGRGKAERASEREREHGGQGFGGGRGRELRVEDEGRR